MRAFFMAAPLLTLVIARLTLAQAFFGPCPRPSPRHPSVDWAFVLRLSCCNGVLQITVPIKIRLPLRPFPLSRLAPWASVLPGIVRLL